MRKTPWGTAAVCKKLSYGLTWYEAYEASGLCVTKRVADKALSESARSIGIKYDGSCWFTHWQVACHENPEWLGELNRLGVMSKIPSAGDIEKYIKNNVPDYFEKIPVKIIEFSEVEVGNLLYLDSVDKTPFLVRIRDESSLIVSQYLWAQKITKKAYFSRVKKVETDNHEMAERIYYESSKHY